MPLLIQHSAASPLFPYTTLFRSDVAALQNLPYTNNAQACLDAMLGTGLARDTGIADLPARLQAAWLADVEDRKSTRLNSSHLVISYAVFCLTKKKKVISMRPALH